MITKKFTGIFSTGKPIVAMIHIQALPGTPGNNLNTQQIVDQACQEAEVLIRCGVQGIMMENMHDTPYLNRSVGPEINSNMTRVACEIRSLTNLPLGIQILAGANQEALAVAQAADLQFIRSEGFVFGHVADEGLMESDAGSLLRYRKKIGAEDIQIFTDVKKKHSSHVLTADISLEETIEAAEFFRSDGAIITGTATGKPVEAAELSSAYEHAKTPILVGSGVSPEGLADIIDHTDAFIVGSYFKKDGNWMNPPDPQRLQALLNAREQLVP